MPALRQFDPTNEMSIQLAGARVTLLRQGALWWAEQQLLVLSDLHFEKGSSYAARGQLLPPYDTASTLSLVEDLVATYSPKICLSLGDSFHDKTAEYRLDGAARDRIRLLTSGVEWVWVEGNHDPDPPASLGGRAAKIVRIGPLVFRHEPIGERGEVAGHLHPVAKVSARGRSVRKKCFAADDTRLIMPALGALTGGLNVLDEAFVSLFPDGVTAYALSAERIYPLARKRLVADRSKR